MTVYTNIGHHAYNMALIIAAHKSVFATREYPCHEPFVTEVCRAVLDGGAVKEIPKEAFDAFQGQKEYFRSDIIGSEGEHLCGVPFETFLALHHQNRPCTCGSGEHWASCQANSQYCG